MSVFIWVRVSRRVSGTQFFQMGLAILFTTHPDGQYKRTFAPISHPKDGLPPVQRLKRERYTANLGPLEEFLDCPWFFVRQFTQGGDWHLMQYGLNPELHQIISSVHHQLQISKSFVNTLKQNLSKGYNVCNEIFISPILKWAFRTVNVHSAMYNEHFLWHFTTDIQELCKHSKTEFE